MAAVCGLTVIKRTPYRGDANEEWSNQYWFTGAVPADSTEWRALFDALVTQEKTLYSSDTTVVRGYGYATDVPTDPTVWTVDMTVSPNTPVAGTLSLVAGASPAPGDVAVWVRWKTSRLSSPGGKAIYLRKYFHDVRQNPSAVRDSFLPAQSTALVAFGTKLRDGSFASGRTIRSQLHPETITGSGVSTFPTTRTLKRRGKRPGS